MSRRTNAPGRHDHDAPIARTVELEVGLAEGVTTLGRVAGNTIAIRSKTVSRRHVEFVRKDLAVWAFNRSAKNPATIDGEILDDRRLAHGNRIRVGDHVEVEFLVRGDPPRPFLVVRGPDPDAPRAVAATSSEEPESARSPVGRTGSTAPADPAVCAEAPVAASAAPPPPSEPQALPVAQASFALVAPRADAAGVGVPAFALVVHGADIAPPAPARPPVAAAAVLPKVAAAAVLPKVASTRFLLGALTLAAWTWVSVEIGTRVAAVQRAADPAAAHAPAPFPTPSATPAPTPSTDPGETARRLDRVREQLDSAADLLDAGLRDAAAVALERASRELSRVQGASDDADDQRARVERLRERLTRPSPASPSDPSAPRGIRPQDPKAEPDQPAPEREQEARRAAHEESRREEARRAAHEEARRAAHEASRAAHEAAHAKSTRTTPSDARHRAQVASATPVVAPVPTLDAPELAAALAQARDAIDAYADPGANPRTLATATEGIARATCPEAPAARLALLEHAGRRRREVRTRLEAADESFARLERFLAPLAAALAVTPDARLSERLALKRTELELADRVREIRRGQLTRSSAMESAVIAELARHAPQSLADALDAMVAYAQRAKVFLDPEGLTHVLAAVRDHRLDSALPVLDRLLTLLETTKTKSPAGTRALARAARDVLATSRKAPKENSQ